MLHYFKVVGSGFLVRATTVMTNRHVIEGLSHEQQDKGFPDDQKYLAFSYPSTEPGKWSLGFCRSSEVTISAGTELDLGFIEFARRPEAAFDQCRPLTIAAPNNLPIVSEPIAACGYPYGTDLLTRDGRMYRFGPVLQRGYISALAPFDIAARPSELLLDLRAAGGMSGSPVYRPDDGTVVGVVYEGWEATVALAIPLDSAKVSAWLESHLAKIGVPSSVQDGTATP